MHGNVTPAAYKVEISLRPYETGLSLDIALEGFIHGTSGQGADELVAFVHRTVESLVHIEQIGILREIRETKAVQPSLLSIGHSPMHEGRSRRKPFHHSSIVEAAVGIRIITTRYGSLQSGLGAVNVLV